MIEAAMIWNEPNNKSHWDPEVDPDWSLYADMVIRAGAAIADANPAVTRVLGGMSPIDPHWVNRMRDHGALDAVDVVAVHGFPLDWNLWPLNDWPARIVEIEAVAPDKPVWVTEVGVGSFGAEEVQVFGLNRTAELLIGRVPRIYWYSLYDLPQEWGATTRHREAEGSSYYRHFYMGLIRADGTPKPALDDYARVAGEMGLMQWFHFNDPRLDDAVGWMKRLGVKQLRTGLSWADSFRPNAVDWFDRQMEALGDFDVTVTFCFTPEHLGIAPHHSSAVHDPQAFADFCAWMIDRYAPASAAQPVARTA
ncbi:beta-xylosidase [Sphingobium sp. TA15]|uniref:Putative beta-xylosidase n=1 Tax=Sphingobium indicum (strain DSM 16413 / CCM 7287 / MTCC 6362 / UT26 / NBRC 101211 / UT26S) TaxID=452662 RepID=D4Z014_SPHIU|nr:beta-xylosidase [Sphingobium indicum]BAI95946.1 putative beta-xylosidase [Sphingobium indicum UT26S]BDD65259.1 beta-xylosidase [Sphingobium sp. TA15]